MENIGKIKTGTKLKMAFDVNVGQTPRFDMICTFSSYLDESAFLVSVPMKDGAPVEADETRKILITYKQVEEERGMILAGYVDDVVKKGIRHYWKIRRVSEQRRFYKRADERYKVALPIKFMQDTWSPNKDGIIEKETGMTLDVSAGGVAMYLNHRFDVGESCIFSMPNIGTGRQGSGADDIVADCCWLREAPKGSPYRLVRGFKFRFASADEKEKMHGYIDFIKQEYKL